MDRRTKYIGSPSPVTSSSTRTEESINYSLPLSVTRLQKSGSRAMLQSDPPLFTFQAPPGWDASKSTTSRRTTDGPILPVDLMSIIIKDLKNDHSLGTLASLQSTSREMYNIATPALYRHIIVDQRQAVELFRLFESFPRSDNTIFLHPAPPDPSTHLINIHLAERPILLLRHPEPISQIDETPRSSRLLEHRRTSRSIQGTSKRTACL